jgi:hypothetical protein
MLSGYWNGGAGCSIETLAELIGDTPFVCRTDARKTPRIAGLTPRTTCRRKQAKPALAGQVHADVMRLSPSGLR